jgi:hypothetical protein
MGETLTYAEACQVLSDTFRPLHCEVTERKPAIYELELSHGNETVLYRSVMRFELLSRESLSRIIQKLGLQLEQKGLGAFGLPAEFQA